MTAQSAADSAAIAVIGTGAFGTALAVHLVSLGHRVALCGRNAAHINSIRETGVHDRVVEGFKVPMTIDLYVGLPQLDQFDAVLIATSCSGFESALEQIRAQGFAGAVVWACKGFSPGTADLLSTRVPAHFGEDHPMAVISGPSFAAELAVGMPTALSVAGNSLDISEKVSQWFHGNNLRTYVQFDMTGVQVGGAIKNVYAIAAGISDGLGFGANARSALITRGLAEMTRLGVEMGAAHNTFLGLSGLGDLTLTCTDNQSRNRRYGLALADGMSDEAALAKVGQAVEGRITARTAKVLADRYDVECPIIDQVYQVVYQNLAPSDAVAALLSRSIKSE